MSAARERLDQLDALHAAGTTGEWQVMSGSDIVTGGTQLGPGSYTWTGHLVAQMNDWRDDSDQKPNDVPVEDDADLIVAAVNALPQLTAALRAALAYADEQKVTWLRDTITAALSPAQPQSGDRP